MFIRSPEGSSQLADSDTVLTVLNGSTHAPFICSHCDKIFSRAYSLRRHQDTCKARNGSFKCPKCDLVFTNINNLDVSAHTLDLNTSVGMGDMSDQDIPYTRVDWSLMDKNRDRISTTSGQPGRKQYQHNDTNKKGNFEPVEYLTSYYLSELPSQKDDVIIREKTNADIEEWVARIGVCVIIQIMIGPLGKAVIRCSLYIPILCYNCHYLMYILYVMK